MSQSPHPRVRDTTNDKQHYLVGAPFPLWVYVAGLVLLGGAFRLLGTIILVAYGSLDLDARNVTSISVWSLVLSVSSWVVHKTTITRLQLPSTTSPRYTPGGGRYQYDIESDIHRWSTTLMLVSQGGMASMADHNWERADWRGNSETWVLIVNLTTFVFAVWVLYSIPVKRLHEGDGDEPRWSPQAADVPITALPSLPPTHIDPWQEPSYSHVDRVGPRG